MSTINKTLLTVAAALAVLAGAGATPGAVASAKSLELPGLDWQPKDKAPNPLGFDATDDERKIRKAPKLPGLDWKTKGKKSSKSQ
jgi:hypothetical protein